MIIQKITNFFPIYYRSQLFIIWDLVYFVGGEFGGLEVFKSTQNHSGVSHVDKIQPNTSQGFTRSRLKWTIRESRRHSSCMNARSNRTWHSRPCCLCFCGHNRRKTRIWSFLEFDLNLECRANRRNYLSPWNSNMVTYIMKVMPNSWVAIGWTVKYGWNFPLMPLLEKNPSNV